MQPYDMKELEERVILVGVQESFSEDVEESLDELAELCETAGALVVGRVIQNREKIHPGTYHQRRGYERSADGSRRCVLCKGSVRTF